MEANEIGNIFSDRISDVPRSFIREILKVAADESIISLVNTPLSPNIHKFFQAVPE
jgi:hypothetical protein